MGYEKIMSFQVILKSPKVWKKKGEKIGLGSFEHFVNILFNKWCYSITGHRVLIPQIKSHLRLHYNILNNFHRILP